MAARLTDPIIVKTDDPDIDIADVSFLVDTSDTTDHSTGSNSRLSVAGSQYELQKVYKGGANVARAAEDGDWRIIEASGNLETQKREGGSWITKSTITA